jgi:carbon monoxide dehydrogenase subunit G
MPKVEGSERLKLARDEVWRLLNDPDTLGASIPGCRGFERDAGAEHRYRTAIKVAVGAVTGVYEGTVEYTDVSEPERCTIKVDGKGSKGTIEGTGAITLTEADDGTDVGYTGDFKITGPVAGVGQRMAPGLSRKMIVETLHNLEQRGLAAGATAAPGGGDSQPAPPPAASPSASAPPEPDAFRPITISPLVAFSVGCVVGGAIVAVLVALV